MDYKDEKLSELLRICAADFLQRESNQTSLITVTRVMISNKGKNAEVLFTVFPEDKETEAIEFTKRKAEEFRKYVSSHVRTRIIPFFRFGIDKGEKNRQNLDLISR